MPRRGTQRALLWAHRRWAFPHGMRKEGIRDCTGGRARWGGERSRCADICASQWAAGVRQWDGRGHEGGGGPLAPICSGKRTGCSSQPPSAHGLGSVGVWRDPCGS